MSSAESFKALRSAPTLPPVTQTTWVSSLRGAVKAMLLTEYDRVLRISGEHPTAICQSQWNKRNCVTHRILGTGMLRERKFEMKESAGLTKRRLLRGAVREKPRRMGEGGKRRRREERRESGVRPLPFPLFSRERVLHYCELQQA